LSFCFLSFSCTSKLSHYSLLVNYYFLNSSNSLFADPFLLYFGTIDGVTVTDSSTTSTVGLSVTSHWGAFEKVGGRTTSDNSQRRFFSSDEGMEFSAISVQDIEWGKQ
jgi:hypothetical protein